MEQIVILIMQMKTTLSKIKKIEFLIYDDKYEPELTFRKYK